MAFRALFIVTYLVFTANVGSAFQLPAANVLEKGVALLMALVYLATRPVDLAILACLPLLVAMIFVLGMLTTYPGFDWGILINALNQLVIFFALLAGVPDRRDKQLLLPFIAFIPIFSVALGFVYQAAGIKNVYALEFATGLLRLGGSVIPAYLSGLAMCGVVAAFQIGLARRPVFLLVAAADFMILLLAGGRAALAVTVVVCGLWMLLNNRIEIKVRVLLGIAGVTAALGMMAVVLERLLTRITSSGFNGRDMLWEYLWTVHEEYPYVGIGFGHQFFTVPDRISIFTGSKAAHNDYIRLLVEVGWIGAIAIYTAMIFVVARMMTRSTSRVDHMIFVAFAGFLMLSYSDNAIAGLPYLILLFVAYLSGLRQTEHGAPARALGGPIGIDRPFPRAQSTGR